MPYKRSKSSTRHKDVIPKTMTRTLVWESDVCIPTNESLKVTTAMVGASLDSNPGFTGDMTCYCPTYLAISANCPSDIFPNMPINASDGDKLLNFTSLMRARGADGRVSDEGSVYDQAARS